MHGTMPLGRYVDKASPVHDLDPRAKLIAMVLYFALVLTIDSLWWLAAVAAGSFLIMARTRISFVVYIRTLRPLRYLIAFIFLFPIIFGAGDLAANAAQGILAAGRMSLFVLFAAILTYTTRMTQLTQGLEALLKPLRALGVSPDRWSLMLNLALRFIPTIIEEAKLILKAQASRGADIADRSWAGKARVMISLLVPVTAGALRRAQQLTDSMEARGFVPGRPRASFHELSWSRGDTWCILTLAVLLLVAVMWKVLV